MRQNTRADHVGEQPVENLPPRDRAFAVLPRLLTADLGFHGANGKYATHGWHPFPAKFPPQLPQFFIEHLSSPGQTVLDPMSGSGTTLVEAQRLGRRAIGCDIDPLARLIAAVKLTPVPPNEALQSGRAALERARSDYGTRRKDLAGELRSRFDGKTRDFLDYWFQRDRQLELLALLRHIEGVENQPVRQFLQVAVSSTIIAKSGGVSLARDLAHTRPHRVLDKVTPSAFMA
ncbi:MAG: site-specific DNA-methyltransferase, partial [Gammaproteobacteria bacterium]|nr:site-specific DNA-methyltransferase [Gammaproteobacteria bacterium]